MPVNEKLTLDNLDKRTIGELRVAFNQALLHSSLFKRSLIEAVNNTQSLSYIVTLEPCNLEEDQASSEKTEEVKSLLYEKDSLRSSEGKNFKFSSSTPHWKHAVEPKKNLTGSIKEPVP